MGTGFTATRRSAVVTGAARGIGRAVTETLLSSTKAHIVAVADAAVKQAPLEWWVNNAGVDVTGGAHEVSADDIRPAFGILACGPLYGTAVAVRRMLPNRHGSIVTVSSIQAIAAFPRYFAYGAAKAALIQAARSVAVDYGDLGIRCNVVLPGVIDTPMFWAGFPAAYPREQALSKESRLSPMLRLGRADEVADASCFLLSERSSYVNGTTLVVDGAATARCFRYAATDGS